MQQPEGEEGRRAAEAEEDSPGRVHAVRALHDCSLDKSAAGGLYRNFPVPGGGIHAVFPAQDTEQTAVCAGTQGAGDGRVEKSHALL